MDDGDADALGEARLEHRGADDEHAGEEYDGGIRQAGENLLRRQDAEQAEGD